ncbi:ligand of Numb protein X 2-like isoform X4 [Periplaneta americana]|uniref:ligand of Numb protein X 2-like isoform X4 n=1 Tax=Periplaneta americana TaxID=6978 RepID=UPI0037E8635B
MEKGRRSGSAACRTCGQAHAAHEPHVYDYVEEVDEDLTCHICLQPFVMPLDIPCGHTFCSACLNNYLRVQQLCPIDRKPLTAHICSPSSIVLRKLLEKLSVRCPNRNGCDKILQRGDLQDHLNLRCPAASVAWSMKSPRCAASKVPSSPTKSKGITRLPVLEGEISHIEIPRLATNLGITIVGGADTALRCVVVQEVFAEGLMSQDGRLRPGDQLIEINGIDMTNASHHQACQALRKMSPVLRLGVYRERIEAYSARSSAHYVEEVHTVNLERQTNQQLGVRLSGWWMEQGIFILEIIPGSPAAKSGQLEPYDRILSVNGEDVANCRLDQASRLIQEPNESLGMRIGGGLGSNEGDIPIYIANIHPQGCVGKTQQIWKGDILLNVNGTSLMGLTHTQAVATLKATVESTQVSLGVLEGPETSLGSLNFIPSWLYWQRLPRCLQFPKTVILHRSPGASLGFSIVGGEDPVRGPEAIHILFVVQDSPAAKHGKLRCGDRLLAVDGHSLENVKHSTAVAMLKQTGSRVTLEVVSWLGTEL